MSPFSGYKSSQNEELEQIGNIQERSHNSCKGFLKQIS